MNLFRVQKYGKEMNDSKIKRVAFVRRPYPKFQQEYSPS